MFKRKDSSQRLVELETENKRLKLENETLKRENELKETNVETLKRENTELRQSLVGPKPQPAPRGLKPTNSQSQASSETTDSNNNSELQRQLNSAIQQLSETRQQLLTVQDRLNVSEQVTAATQRRELVQEGAFDSLPTTSVYEELRFDPTQEHVYAKLQLPTHRGCMIVFNSSCEKIFTLIMQTFFSLRLNVCCMTLQLMFSLFMILAKQIVLRQQIPVCLGLKVFPRGWA